MNKVVLRMPQGISRLSKEDKQDLICKYYWEADVDLDGIIIRYCQGRFGFVIHPEDFVEIANEIYTLSKSLDALQNGTKFIEKHYTFEELIDRYYLMTTF